VSLILWGWLLAQYPYVIPPALTIREAAAPAVTLAPAHDIGLAAGAAILLAVASVTCCERSSIKEVEKWRSGK
jgi:hypothetical protein